MKEVLDLRREAQLVFLKLPDLPEVKDVAVRTWHGRMVNEFQSASVFEGLAKQLRSLRKACPELDIAEDTAKSCEAFAREEREHGVLCGAVVEALGARAYAREAPTPPYPCHEDAGVLEATLRNVLSICCMSETVAVSLIAAERVEMPTGDLRTLLTRIWADEIGHARFGWKLVGELMPHLEPAAKDRLDRYLMLALAHFEQHELNNIPLNPKLADGEQLGVCGGHQSRTLLYETIDEIILPGLESVGLAARQAWKQRTLS